MSADERIGFFFWDIRDRRFQKHHFENEEAFMFFAATESLPEIVDLDPLSIQIEVTDRCNLSCPYCPRFGDDYTIKNVDLGFESFARLANQFPHLRHAHLQGLGEPFLVCSFPTMLDYLKLRSCYVSTTTNGLLVTRRTLDWIAEGKLDEIEVSIDGASRETYERSRPGASFSRLLRNVEKLAAVAGPKGIRLKVNTVATAQNLDDLINLPALVDGLGIKEIYIDEVNLKYGVERWRAWSPTLACPQRAAEVYDGIRALASQLGMHVQINTPRLSQKRVFCLWPWVSTYVTCLGLVTPCCCIVDHVCGDLNETSFLQIWNGPVYQDFRRSLRDGPLPIQCVNCNYL